MKNEYDIIIIGAGPAGLSCAIELQNCEMSILILEKNEKIGPKICAGGLTTKIENLGISLEAADKLFSSVKVNLPKKQKTISDKKPFVATINRERLGEILFKKITQKIEVKTGSLVTKIDNDFIEVDGEKIKYKYLVGADGGDSIVRKFLGLKTKKILTTLQYIVPREFKEFELFFNPYLFDWGYAWIFPHKNHTAVGCGKDARFLKEFSLKDNFDKWLKSQNIEVEGLYLQGGVINFDYQGFHFGNKFLIGDAAGFASGMTGEGIYFAMISGQEVARKIMNSDYKTIRINKILRIKHTQELLLKILPLLNRPLLNLFFNFSFSLFKFDWFKKKALKLYS